MPNRQQRRQQAKQKKTIKRPSYHGLSEERKLEKLFQNGITAKDLEEEFHNGFNQGYALARDNSMKMCYAAVCLALKERGFDQDQILNLLLLMDSKVLFALDNEELIDQVLDETGLELHFSNVLENRVQKKEA